jgi:hypothetical protein
MDDIKDVCDGGSLSMTALSKLEHLRNPRKSGRNPPRVEYGNGDENWFSANLSANCVDPTWMEISYVDSNFTAIRRQMSRRN